MMTIIYTLSISLMILTPLGLAILLRRRASAPWMGFCVGMATFALAQAVHLPLNHALEKLGWLQLPVSSGGQPLWLTALILGLTAGLCEELGRAAGYALLKKARRLPDGLMMGLGHGGLEAMVFGGLLTAATLGSLLPIVQQGLDAPQFAQLSIEQLENLSLQIERLLSSPWLGFAPLVERLLALGLQVVFSAMVLRAFQRRQPAWVLLAILYHLLVDAAAVILAAQTTNVVWIEGGLAVAALPGYLWLGRLFRAEMPPITGKPNPLRREIYLFGVALRKELLQLLRTQRILITAVVFGLFGMASPLLAYFTPELLRLIPGAEAFAALIPQPTAGDAMLQYHKNLTQFAFLLAVLFGMGSVAGEKESGAATLVLSKPLPRWAYLSAKFSAQSLLFGFGLILSAVGGYVYTVILFGKLKLGLFLVMNLALWGWILPFIALTLVGSVLGGSVSAAGGIALALVLALTLAGSLPQVGELLPTALSGWAALLGVQAAGVAASTPGSPALPAGEAPPNLGALAAALVFVLAGLIIAFAFFERQEL